jgi:hypothetical protein
VRNAGEELRSRLVTPAVCPQGARSHVLTARGAAGAVKRQVFRTPLRGDGRRMKTGHPEPELKRGDDARVPGEAASEAGSDRGS